MTEVHSTPTENHARVTGARAPVTGDHACVSAPPPSMTEIHSTPTENPSRLTAARAPVPAHHACAIDNHWRAMARTSSVKAFHSGVLPVPGHQRHRRGAISPKLASVARPATPAAPVLGVSHGPRVKSGHPRWQPRPLPSVIARHAGRPRLENTRAPVARDDRARRALECRIRPSSITDLRRCRRGTP